MFELFWKNYEGIFGGLMFVFIDVKTVIEKLPCDCGQTGRGENRIIKGDSALF